jgi:hypothetical protein
MHSCAAVLQLMHQSLQRGAVLCCAVNMPTVLCCACDPRHSVLQMMHRYQNLLRGAEDVESCLLESFAEYLNAEIVLQTVKDVAMAIEWLKTTFLYTRVGARPPFTRLIGTLLVTRLRHCYQLSRGVTRAPKCRKFLLRAERGDCKGLKLASSPETNRLWQLFMNRLAEARVLS